MGVSTDAYLFFGIELDEEFDWEEQELDPYEIETPEIEISFHCHGEHPIWFITHKELSYSANRGYPAYFSDLPTVHEYQREAISKFFIKHNLLYGSGPKWTLASCWC